MERCCVCSASASYYSKIGESVLPLCFMHDAGFSVFMTSTTATPDKDASMVFEHFLKMVECNRPGCFHKCLRGETYTTMKSFTLDGPVELKPLVRRYIFCSPRCALLYL